MWKLVLGGALAFVLLAFVNKFSLFGAECFYFGSMNPNTMCLHPPVYYGAWAIAVAFILWGLIPMIRAQNN
jgi:hypothetical protein